jgi:hypothetical protein
LAVLAAAVAVDDLESIPVGDEPPLGHLFWPDEPATAPRTALCGHVDRGGLRGTRVSTDEARGRRSCRVCVEIAERIDRELGR